MLVTPEQLLADAIGPAGALLPSVMSSRNAARLQVAIALQESGLESRWQIVDRTKPRVKGPARGLWQFERDGGCLGVFTHPASRYWANQLCLARKHRFSVAGIYAGVEVDDVLAAGMARLLLFTDPRILPGAGEEAAAWRYYVRCWRPGKPHLKTWPGHWATACRVVPA